MSIMKGRLWSVLLAAALASGCASYRASSNITSDAPSALPPHTKVLISEDSLPGRKYQVLGPVEVSVKKLTVFHKDPTKEQANATLAEKARAIGANAVINTTYTSGIGLTTWGYLDASGTGVRLAD